MQTAWSLLLVSVVVAGTLSGAEEATTVFRQYCFTCHGKSAAGGINLQQLTSQPNFGDSFQQWQRIATALEQKRMPPATMPQPADDQRYGAATWVRARLSEFAEKHAGDPGKVTVRRLTSGEYGYAIRDLTGLELRLDKDFASDSVGGEGFTNFGDVQFMADANLERYLETAKKIADHVVTGSGPLLFFDDPGKSGFELSAISRIHEIYRANGFRANSGEGGKPFGLERYSKAFYVCWLYQNREALREHSATLKSLAVREGVSPRLAKHLWTVLHDPAPTYPTSEVLSRWQRMPAPAGTDHEQALAAGRTGSEALMQALVDWPRWLFAAGGVAEGGDGDERALVLSDDFLKPTTTHHYKFPLRIRGNKNKTVYLSLVSVNPGAKDKPVVVWRDASVRIREGKDKGFGQPQPLRSLLEGEAIARLGFGRTPDGKAIDPQEFAMSADSTVSFELKVPDDTFGTELQIDAVLASDKAGDAVLRCTVSDSAEVSKGRPVWALLGDAKSPGYQFWRAGVLEFAAKLPQNSQGEAAPADKDPIPLPFDNTYNQPERDHFHAKLKYFRDDRFLYEHVLDDAARLRLDQAWNDLLTSFEYHDIFLRFVSTKYHLQLKKRVSELTAPDVEALPSEPQKYVRALWTQYNAMENAELSARPGHVDDCLRLASQAWRRPLTQAEKDKLRSFYVTAREQRKLDHGKAIELLVARILVSPAFLYRLEQPAQRRAAAPLPDMELASRLSFFLWSSVPDDELRRLAEAGQLNRTDELQRQVKRMLADLKARRFSTEFFGQWLGFYRFDQHRGVDAKRFPEFTDEVRAAMYDEAISFFEYIVRKDRPVREVLAADYTFLNKPLAKHYGIQREVASAHEVELVEGASEFHRGGLLRLGAVLTATSAPLRTSPVKRGDWVLRRILGTPTPPPPADAGSIPADDKLFGGLSVKNRLAAHQRNATCASCHSRIDPLGFPLERYDSVGRWRQTYGDGTPVQESSTTTDGTEIAGVDGLLSYLKSHEPQVLRTMSGKLIGYALGRTVLASDQPLIDRLIQAGGDASFSKLATEIVTSKQFRYRRGAEDTSPPPSEVQNESKSGGGL